MEVDGQETEHQDDLPVVGAAAAAADGDQPAAAAAGGGADADAEEDKMSEGAASTSTSTTVATAKDDVIRFKLTSPMGGRPLEFTMDASGKNNHESQEELKHHLTNIFRFGLGIKEAFEKAMGKSWEDLPWTDVNECPKVVARLNKCIACVVQMWRGATQQSGCDWFQSPYCTAPQMKKLSTLLFSRAVKNANVLNKCYRPFSNETYGETSFEQIELILDKIQLTDKDVFVDMGSGVGHIVTYVSGYSQVKKAVGIEINDIPADKAESLKSDFQTMMSWYGKKYRPFELHKGSFLEPRFRDLLTKEATVLFMNNFAFDHNLMYAIRQLVYDLQDGTRIICTKSISELREDNSQNGGADNAEDENRPNRPATSRKGRAITDRTLQRQAIDMILDVEMLPRCEVPVSWSSGKDVNFYLFTVNTRKLERIYEQRNTEGSNSTRSGSSESVHAAAGGAAAAAAAAATGDDALDNRSIAATIDEVVSARGGGAAAGGGAPTAAAVAARLVKMYPDEDDDDDGDEDYQEPSSSARKWSGLKSAEKRRAASGRDKKSSGGASGSRHAKKEKKDKHTTSSAASTPVRAPSVRAAAAAAAAAASAASTPIGSLAKDDRAVHAAMHGMIKNERKVKKEEEAALPSVSSSSRSRVASSSAVVLDPANPMDAHLSKSRGRAIRATDASAAASSSSSSARGKENRGARDQDAAASKAKTRRATLEPKGNVRKRPASPSPAPLAPAPKYGKIAAGNAQDNWDPATAPAYAGQEGMNWFHVCGPHHTIFDEAFTKDLPKKRGNRQ